MSWPAACDAHPATLTRRRRLSSDPATAGCAAHCCVAAGCATHHAALSAASRSALASVIAFAHDVRMSAARSCAHSGLQAAGGGLPPVGRRLLLGDRCPERISGADRALGAARASGSQSGRLRAAHHAPINSVQWGGSTQAAVCPRAGIASRRLLAGVWIFVVRATAALLDRSYHLDHTTASVSLSMKSCRQRWAQLRWPFNATGGAPQRLNEL